MKIELAKDVEDFLVEQVRAGVCANATELANDVLRSLRELQRKPFEVTPELGCLKQPTSQARRWPARTLTASADECGQARKLPMHERPQDGRFHCRH